MFKLDGLSLSKNFHSFDFHINDKCYVEKNIYSKFKYFSIFPSFPIFSSVRSETSNPETSLNFKVETKKRVHEIFFSKKSTNFFSIPSILIKRAWILNSKKFLIIKLGSKFLKRLTTKKLNLLCSTYMHNSSFLVGETIFLLYSFPPIIPTLKLNNLVYILQKRLGFILQKKIK